MVMIRLGSQIGNGYSGIVLAEAGHRVLVALVIVGPDVDVARRRIDTHAFELADDRFIIGPAAGQLVGLLDRDLEHVERV